MLITSSVAQDGNHDLNGIRDAIAAAKADTDRPTLIKVSTLIGYGSPNRAGTHDVHGAALGKDETAATREHLQWNYAPFEIPEEAYKALSHVEAVRTPPHPCLGARQPSYPYPTRSRMSAPIV